MTAPSTDDTGRLTDALRSFALDKDFVGGKSAAAQAEVFRAAAAALTAAQARIAALEGALRAFIKAEEDWQATQERMRFNDPLTDALAVAKAALSGSPADAQQKRIAALEGAKLDWARAYWRLTKNMSLSELADYDDELASAVAERRQLAEQIVFDLSGSPSAPPAPDPRDAVVAAIEVRQARKQHSAARLSVTGELKAANDRLYAAERSLEAAVDRLAPTKGDG